MIRNTYRTLFLILAILAGISLAAAADTGRDQDTGACTIRANLSVPFYITMSPIGNHSAGEPFIVHGTTNLPACYSLVFSIHQPELNPGGYNSWFDSKVAIDPGTDGINSWSVNASSPFWTVCNGPMAGCSEYRTYTPYSGTYIASISFRGNSSLGQSQRFILSPDETMRSQYFDQLPKPPSSPPPTPKAQCPPVLAPLAVAGVAGILCIRKQGRV